MKSMFKPLVLLTCKTFLVLSLSSSAHLTAACDHSSGLALGSPDIIEISVQHLTEVQNQLSQGLGISWRAPHTSTSHVKIGDEVHEVTITRVFSDSALPYVELIQAVPQIGPWAPFNDEFGIRPRSIIAWRLNDKDFDVAKHQIGYSGMTKTAEGSDFAYYESVEGVQLEIVRDNLAPNPNNGKPNTPPAGLIDFGAMNYISIPLQLSPNTPAADIPRDDFIVRQQISAATGGGITWDINTPIVQFIPYIQDANPTVPVLLNNPSLVYSCNATPFLNFLVINPLITPFGATATTTTFSHAWVAAGSGFDPAGTAIMDSYENQLFAAGFQSIIRLDAQTLGITPYPSDFLRYFEGIDGVNIQVVNVPGSNITPTCTGCVGVCN